MDSVIGGRSALSFDTPDFFPCVREREKYEITCTSRMETHHRRNIHQEFLSSFRPLHLHHELEVGKIHIPIHGQLSPFGIYAKNRLLPEICVRSMLEQCISVQVL